MFHMYQRENYPEKKDDVFRLGELFCGPGGLACGALRSKSNDGVLSVEHAWANDYDADTCETYRKNICPQNNSPSRNTSSFFSG